MSIPVVKEKKIEKTVLLFSGGLDSYLVYKLFNPDVLLYVACNHKYQSRELRAIKDLNLNKKIIVDYSLDLEKWERVDAIVPLRNLLFSAVASRYGDVIWMGALAGEINWDKSKQFMALAGLTMSHCYNQSYWNEGRVVYVESPVVHLTKTQLLAQACKVGIPVNEFSKTVSCYHKDGFCGECSSCFKRWIACTLNGIVEKYKVNPGSGVQASIAIAKLIDKTYTGLRAIETATALSYVREKTVAWPKEIKDEVIRRVTAMKTNGDFTVNA